MHAPASLPRTQGQSTSELAQATMHPAQLSLSVTMLTRGMDTVTVPGGQPCPLQISGFIGGYLPDPEKPLEQAIMSLA